MMKIKSMKIKIKFLRIRCLKMSLRSRRGLVKEVKNIGREMFMNPNRNLASSIITLSLTNFQKIEGSCAN